MALEDRRTFDSLIIVCCHAIWIGGPTSGEDESEWLIEPFQSGETPTFIEHIKTGIAELAANDKAILVFSGGPTKRPKTLFSEAQSYLNLAIAHDCFNYSPLTPSSVSLRQRLFIDSFATDSYQNILFPLVQFHSYSTGIPHIHASLQPSFPRHLTIVSHEFKRQRFCQLHLPAQKWPVDVGRLNYVGIDPPFDKVKMLEIREGDRKKGFGVWREDLYGTGFVLKGKRMARGWTEEMEAEILELIGTHMNHSEALERLMEWNGGETMTEIFPGTLPWQ